MINDQPNTEAWLKVSHLRQRARDSVLVLAAADDEPHRHPPEPEGLPDPVGEVAAVGVVPRQGTVREEHEGRRTVPHLGGVVELPLLAVASGGAVGAGGLLE